MHFCLLLALLAAFMVASIDSAPLPSGSRSTKPITVDEANTGCLRGYLNKPASKSTSRKLAKDTASSRASSFRSTATTFEEEDPTLDESNSAKIGRTSSKTFGSRRHKLKKPTEQYSPQYTDSELEYRADSIQSAIEYAVKSSKGASTTE
ncbi:hypothetical protein CBS101457_006887 [Exobasidium rhododendri]|nr:hypothetical protein CBS101457_006887 [Exobasidium rhododendri]